MSTVELGACLRLLCIQWLDGFIPDDVGFLARLCRLDAAAMADVWVMLSGFFPVVEPGKRANRYMRAERDKVVANLERKSDEGIRAARKRWDKAEQQRNGEPHGSPHAEPHGPGNADGNGYPIQLPMQEEIGKPNIRGGAVARTSTHQPALASATKKNLHVRMPEGFRPNDGHRSLAKESGINLEETFGDFARHHAIWGSKSVNWNKSLTRWLQREANYVLVRKTRKQRTQLTALTSSAARGLPHLDSPHKSNREAETVSMDHRGDGPPPSTN